MRLYSLDEVLQDVKDKGLSFPFAVFPGENLVFTQLYSSYCRMIREQGLGNAFKQQCSFPMADILPTEHTRFWVYIKLFKDNKTRMFFKTSRSARLVEVVNQRWSTSICRKLYVVDTSDKLVVPFSGTSLNTDHRSTPERLEYY